VPSLMMHFDSRECIASACDSPAGITAVLKGKALTIGLVVAVLVASIWPTSKLDSEFMPNPNEGRLFNMPKTLPGLSITRRGQRCPNRFRRRGMPL
jgi:Cu/Ag efflux pump CusA